MGSGGCLRQVKLVDPLLLALAAGVLVFARVLTPTRDQHPDLNQNAATKVEI
jgi:hypothetical protein